MATALGASMVQLNRAVTPSTHTHRAALPLAARRSCLVPSGSLRTCLRAPASWPPSSTSQPSSARWWWPSRCVRSRSIEMGGRGWIADAHVRCIITCPSPLPSSLPLLADPERDRHDLHDRGAVHRARVVHAVLHPIRAGHCVEDADGVLQGVAQRDGCGLMGSLRDSAEPWKPPQPSPLHRLINNALPRRDSNASPTSPHCQWQNAAGNRQPGHCHQV